VRQVGTVRSIHRYPVKSMRGEALEQADLSLQGIPFDRQYAFVQAGSRSIFPWLTGRECPDLLRYQAAVQATPGSRPAVAVTTPSQQVLAADDEALLKELADRSGRSLFLLRDYRGSFDVAQVSLIGSATVEGIDAACEGAVEPARFRANFYVDTEEGQPFDEDGWVGRVIRIGETARVAVTERDARCAMITLDPRSGEPRTEVLTAVARLHDNTAGVYGVVLTAGPVRTGDPILLEA
jgi:uncharacterized protein YcbX